MGYFSNYAIDYAPRPYIDHSYTTPEMQLQWRLEDLEQRLEELTNRQTGSREVGACLTEAELRYVLPWDILAVADVRKAINLAIEDLRDRYGIRIFREEPEPLPVLDEITGMQITFLDILSDFSQRAA